MNKCPNCGKRTRNTYCYKCRLEAHAKEDNGYQRCTSCGQKIHKYHLIPVWFMGDTYKICSSCLKEIE